MARRIAPTYRTESTKGSSGGGNIGAGLLGAVGGILGSAAGPGVGTLTGAAAGAGLGSMLGNAISPARAGSETTMQNPRMASTPMETAMNSQIILDGLRTVMNDPGLSREYARPLAQAYMESMVRLKQMG